MTRCQPFILGDKRSTDGFCALRVPVLSTGLATTNARSYAQDANAPPRQVPARVTSETSTAPHPPSRNWFQIRHRQGESRANGHHRFTFGLPAILARVIVRGLPGTETPFLLQTAPNRRRQPLFRSPAAPAAQGTRFSCLTEYCFSM
jgi:hypothetical protein